MADQGRERRALPPPLVLGLGLKGTVLVCAMAAAEPDPTTSGRVIATGGVALAATVLVGYGLLALASRHTAKVRRGLQVAGLGWLVLAVLQEVSDLAFASGWGVTSAIQLVQYGFGVALLGSAVGLAVAVWHRRPVLAVLGVASVILGSLVVVLVSMYGLGDGFRVFLAVDAGVALVRVAVVAATACVLAGEPQVVDSAPAAGYLRGAARALRLGVGVMICVTGVLVLFAPHGGGSSMVIRLAGALGVVAGSVTFAWLGRALLGAARERGTAIAPYPVAVAAVFALWCGRMLLLVLPAVCGDGPSVQSRDIVATVLPGAPICVVLGAAVLSATIGSFARRARIDALWRRGHRHAVGVIVVAVALPFVMFPAFDLHPSLAALIFVITCCAQTVLLARLCESAARAVDRGSVLPQVRVVSS